MRIAILSDIHANRAAFEACLEQVYQRGPDRLVLLGDYVGYGADPGWCVDKVMELAAGGALVIQGNHDAAIANPRESMNAIGRAVIDWTRGQLSTPQRDFLAGLPLTAQEGNTLLVHADASAPQSWNYIRDADSAIKSLRATEARLTICGHTHSPALFALSVVAKLTTFTPTTDAPVPLLPTRQWLAVAGSVGQPRDGNPAAAYLMLDSGKNELTWCRAPYDIAASIAAIRKNGLPEALCQRLSTGR